jgi:beta-glucosidase
VSREAALMGMVLLKNDGLLPLHKNSSIAVVGPMAVNTQLMSDYAGGWNGVAGCWPKGDESCIVTIGEAIALANGGSATQTAIVQGVDVNSNRTNGIGAAIALADAAETVVLVLGNDRSTENENLDRPIIDLPGQQQELARRVLALGKPTLLILSNGGAVAIDGLIAGPKAIVEAFSPAQQAPALASLLFGDENRWGHLPYTICKQTVCMAWTILEILGR